MRTIVIATLLALSVSASATAKNVDGPIPHRQLRGSDCIDTTNINDWKIVDARTAIVRTGPKRYLIKLQSSCPQLSNPPGLMFKSNTAGANQGRICGGIGESVRTRGNLPACPIQSVSMIDKASYDKLSAAADRYRKAKH